MMKSQIIKLFLISCFFCASMQANAAVHVFLGGLGGIDKADNTSMKVYGGTAGVRLMNFGLGGYYLAGKKNGITIGAVSADVKHTMYGVEPSLFLGDRLTFRGGVKVGVSKVEGKIRVLGVQVDTSNSDFSIGPSIGLDLKLLSFLSIGAEGSYLYVAADDNYKVILGLAAVKLWF